MTIQNQGEEQRQRILEAIRRFIIEHMYSPTYQEIGALIEGGMSRPGVQYQIEKLAKMGLLTYKKGDPRTIVLTGQQVTFRAQK